MCFGNYRFITTAKIQKFFGIRKFLRKNVGKNVSKTRHRSSISTRTIDERYTNDTQRMNFYMPRGV